MRFQKCIKFDVPNRKISAVGPTKSEQSLESDKHSKTTSCQNNTLIIDSYLRAFCFDIRSFLLQKCNIESSI